MRAALSDAEVRLGAFSASTRYELESDSDTIDLEEEQRAGELEAAAARADTPAGEAASVPAVASLDGDWVLPDDEIYPSPVPRTVPKGRFTVPGLTPDRIEALRDELTP